MRPFEAYRPFSIMMLRRPWLVILLAGCSWAHVSLAQSGSDLFGNPTAPPGSNPSGTNTGTNTGTRTGTTGNTGTTGGTTEETPPATPPPTPPPEDTKPPRNPFGFDNPVPETPEPKKPGANGASTTFGQDQINPNGTPETTGRPGQTKSEGSAPSFTAPGLLGSLRQNFTSGEGRFSKPKFRYGASVGMGFDDNYLAAPGTPGTEDSEIIQTIPAQPEIVTFRSVREFAGLRPSPGPGGPFLPFYRIRKEKIVLRPAVPEQRIVIPIPGIPGSPRESSIVSTANLYFNTQFAKPRSALTFDLRLGMEYYWDRKKSPADYNGSLSMLYLRKLSPRMQFTANANIIHQAQPDFSVVNVNTNSANAGRSFTNGFLKFDLGYRWKPRFSTDTSATVQALVYDDAAFKGANFLETTFSNEFRYIRSPKTTYVVEVRYGIQDYPDNEAINSTTAFLLVGLDQRWSKRLNSTFRLGEALRAYSAGGSQATPYAEFSAAYKASARSQVNLSGRYGFEQTQSATDKSVTFRAGLGYSYLFTRRLTANLGLNYVNTETKSELLDITSDFTTTDLSLSVAYQASRRLNLNAQLSYTGQTTTAGTTDYDRTRFFLTGSYDF